MTTTTTTTETKAAAWAFILENARQIDGAGWEVVSGTPLEYDDGRAELVAYIATNHHKWNPKRGWGARTWIRMQARKVRRSMVRAGVRNTGAPLSDDDLIQPWASGSQERAEARAEVAMVMAKASKAQRAAVVSVLEDWTASTVRERLGTSTRERDRLVASLSEARI